MHRDAQARPTADPTLRAVALLQKLPTFSNDKIDLILDEDVIPLYSPLVVWRQLQRALKPG